MHHDLRAGDAVHRCVNAARRQFHGAFTFHSRTRFVEDDEIARTSLRPVQAKGQNKKAISGAWNGHREVVVDTLIQLVQHREAVRCSKIDSSLTDGVDVARRRKGMHGHRDTCVVNSPRITIALVRAVRFVGASSRAVPVL